MSSAYDIIKPHRLPTDEHAQGRLKVAVIGGNGFLGRHLLYKLGTTYTNLSLYSLDQNKHGIYLKAENFHSPLTQVTMPVHLPGVALSWVRAHKPDVVIYMAGKEGPSSGLNRMCNIVEDTEAVVGLNRCLQAFEEVRPSYFTYVSSAAVYGNHGKKAVRETSKLNPDNHVGQIRLAAEQAVVEFCEAMDIGYSILRPSEIYGRHNWLQLLDENYWPGFLSYYTDRSIEVIDYKLTGKLAPTVPKGFPCEKVNFLLTPSSMIDLVHVDYVVNVIEKMCRERTKGVYNVSSGQPYTLENLADIIKLSIQEHPALPYIEFKSHGVEYNKKSVIKRSHALVASEKVHGLVPYSQDYSLKAFVDSYLPVRMKEIREHREYVEAVIKTNILDTTNIPSFWEIMQK